MQRVVYFFRLWTLNSGLLRSSIVRGNMESQLTTNEILKFLRAEKTFLNRKFGVVDIGLFGSYATGQSHPDSDIDLIVELKEPRFEWIAGLQVYLENKFNRRIELIRKGSYINPRFIKRVEKEIIYV